MVRSVFAVAAPFKGTPTVYLLGASYTGSHLLRTFSVRGNSTLRAYGRNPHTSHNSSATFWPNTSIFLPSSVHFSPMIQKHGTFNPTLAILASFLYLTTLTLKNKWRQNPHGAGVASSNPFAPSGHSFVPATGQTVPIRAHMMPPFMLLMRVTGRERASSMQIHSIAV